MRKFLILLLMCSVAWGGSQDLGNQPEDATVYVRWNSFDSNGAPIAPSAAFTTADFNIYKDGSATEKTSANGLTIASPFDAQVGYHVLTIDTSNDTGDAGFWVAGSTYVVIFDTAKTVDTQSVDGVEIAYFSLEDRYNDSTDYGALKPTTAGRTLDVTTTGEAGVDFSNIAGTLDAAEIGGDAITAAKIGADAIGTSEASALATAAAQTTAQNDLDIITGAAGALLDSTATSAQLVDDVWDEVLTGGTHNVANSSGRRLRNLQDFGVYEGGYVYIDTVGGTAGTTDFENGTVNNPVDTIADALTLAGSVGLYKLYVYAGSSITLPAAPSVDGYIISGNDYTLALAARSVDNTLIQGATSISGTFTGTPHIIESVIGNITGPTARIGWCGIGGTITINGAGDWFVHDCWSEIAGTATPILDIGATILNTNVSWRNYSGGLEVQNMGDAGTDTMSYEGRGQLVLNANCDAGSLSIRGLFTLTDNSGNVTITDGARFDNQADIDAILADTGTDGVLLASNAITAAVIATDAITAAKIAADALTSSEIAADAIGASELATDAIGALELAATALAEFITVDTGETTAAAGSVAKLAQGSASSLTEAGIADAVWDEARSGHTTAGTFGLYLDAQVSSVGAGTGAVTVTSSTNDDAADNMLFQTAGGTGIGGATVRFYVTSEYIVGDFSTVRAVATTASDGSWGPVYLDDGVQYTVEFFKEGYAVATTTVTPSA